MADIAIEGATKVYPDGTEAVSDLNLDIHDGEFVVLVGPSGCGKTTGLRMVAGLEEISSGTVRIGDRVVNDLPPKDRDVAMVFQNYALYPHMSVYDNMAFALKLRKMSKDEIDAPGARGGRDPRPHGVPAAQAEGALGRAASARGHGARDRARAAGVPHGRAAVEPRREAAGADARGDREAAAGPGRDDDLRHARPDRGHDDGRPRGRDEAGRTCSRSTRRRCCTTARRTSSSPGSSVRPR